LRDKLGRKALDLFAALAWTRRFLLSQILAGRLEAFAAAPLLEGRIRVRRCRLGGETQDLVGTTFFALFFLAQQVTGLEEIFVCVLHRFAHLT